MKLSVRAKRDRESGGVTLGVRIRGVQEIQLKSLILAQPERWRRG
jgi:hypothetical protein